MSIKCLCIQKVAHACSDHETIHVCIFPNLMCVFSAHFRQKKMGKKKKSNRVFLRCLACNVLGHEEGPECRRDGSAGPEATSTSVEPSNDGAAQIVEPQAATVQVGAFPAPLLQAAAAVDADVPVLPPALLAQVEASKASF
jgi:hypothetical protein